MFLLDTNILSAMMSAQRVPEVAAWVAGQPLELLFTTAISRGPIPGAPAQGWRAGIEQAPKTGLDIFISISN
jgi:predicted nucleic acid-binding protein